MVDPFKRGLQFGVKSGQGHGVDAGGGDDAAFGNGGGRLPFRWLLVVCLRLRAVDALGGACDFGGVGLGNWGKASFSEAFEDTAGFFEQVVGTVVLTTGYQGQCSG